MTTLVVQTLVNELSQDFEIVLNERYHLGAIIPYLYFHNPVGTFTIELVRDLDTIFSKSFTLLDVQTALDTNSNYIHCFYPIIPDAIKLEKGQYKIKLTASGYSSNPSSFIGWCQQFEDVQNEMNYLPLSDDENSLAFRVKIYKEGVL